MGYKRYIDYAFSRPARAMDDAGNSINLSATQEGHLEVAVHSPNLPFGSIHVESLHHQIQLDAVYGLISNQVSWITSSTGLVSVDNSRFKLSIDNTQYAYAILGSRRRIRYRPGQGILGRFTAIFGDTADNLYQIAGYGHAEDGIYFGYSGSTFGILHKHDGVREIRALTLTSPSTSSANLTIRLNNIAFTVPVTSGSLSKNAYEISTYTGYVGWYAEQSGTSVVFLSSDAVAKSSTFSVTGGGGGLTGTFATIRSGSAGTDDWIPQTQWNGDKLDGTGASGFTLDPTKGNVYQIGVQYLGYGTIRCAVEATFADSNNSDFVTAHLIKRPNTYTGTNFSNPAFPFLATSYSYGSTQSSSMYIGSVYGGVEGRKQLTGPRFSYLAQSNAVNSTSFRTLFSVRNNRVYKGKANQSVVNILGLVAALKANQPCIVYLIKEATLSGSTEFNNYSSESSTSWDTGSTTCTFSTQNQLIYSTMLGDTGNVDHEFTDELTIQPGETITVAAKSVTGSPSWVAAGLNTREDQ